MFIARTPLLLRKIPYFVVWNFPCKEKTLYLTFDDGPTQGITEKILDLLKQHDARATFFCVGKNIQSHPGLLEKIQKDGHSIGNHTHNHLNGWKTKNKEYCEDVFRAAKEFRFKLFRPPYGRISTSQILKIRKHYKIIMWDVLSGDYNKNISGEKCAENVIKNAKNGSVIVFHDSLKASKNMLYALPKVLEHFSERGYRFSAIV